MAEVNLGADPRPSAAMGVLQVEREQVRDAPGAGGERVEVIDGNVAALIVVVADRTERMDQGLQPLEVAGPGLTVGSDRALPGAAEEIRSKARGAVAWPAPAVEAAGPEPVGVIGIEIGVVGEAGVVERVTIGVGRQSRLDRNVPVQQPAPLLDRGVERLRHLRRAGTAGAKSTSRARPVRARGPRPVADLRRIENLPVSERTPDRKRPAAPAGRRVFTSSIGQRRRVCATQPTRISFPLPEEPVSSAHTPDSGQSLEIRTAAERTITSRSGIEVREGGKRQEVTRRAGRHDVGDITRGDRDRAARADEILDVADVEQLADQTRGRTQQILEVARATAEGAAVPAAGGAELTLAVETMAAASVAAGAAAGAAERARGHTASLADAAAHAAAGVAALAKPVEVPPLELAPRLSASHLRGGERYLARRPAAVHSACSSKPSTRDR